MPEEDSAARQFRGSTRCDTFPLARDQIQAQRWSGAADVPGAMGRVHATVPLGVLELSGAVLTLRVRPRLLAAMFGAKPLVLAPAEVDAIFPARGRLRSSAIGIRPRGAPPSYFLRGGDRTPILS